MSSTAPKMIIGMNNSAIKSHPPVKEKLPAGKKSNSPTRTRPQMNFVKALKRSFVFFIRVSL
jgi:hypothetical protein